MDYHFIYTNYSNINENLNQIDFLIKSILKTEIEQINEELLQNKTSIVFHLKTNIFLQLIQFLIEPSLLNENFDYETIPDEEVFITKPNLNFIFKILNIFVDLIKDKSILKQQIDLIIEILFPQLLINLLFHLFLLAPTHQSKIFILHLFST